LTTEILERIKANSHQFFKRQLVDIMMALGYCGSHAAVDKSIGQSSDNGKCDH